MEIFSNQTLLLSAIVGTFIGAAAGYLGSIMVLRRMALAGDVLSHVALPGIGLALIYNLNPFLLGFLFLAVASFLIWFLEGRTKTPTDAIIGVVFVAALAFGILITPELELAEALFGKISEVRLLDGVFAVLLSIIVFIAARKIYKNLILGIISEDLAVSSGVNLRAISLIYLFLVAVTVALGIKVIGTLLMGALLIVPAASAKNISGSLRSYGALSTVFGLLSVPAGIILSGIFELPPGPIVVLVSIFIFLLSLFSKR